MGPFSRTEDRKTACQSTYLPHRKSRGVSLSGRRTATTIATNVPSPARIHDCPGVYQRTTAFGFGMRPLRVDLCILRPSNSSLVSCLPISPMQSHAAQDFILSWLPLHTVLIGNLQHIPSRWKGRREAIHLILPRLQRLVW